ALAGATDEFSNLTLDASVTTSTTYTMATNALRMSGTLTIRNSTGGATGWTVLTTSGANLGITVGGLAVSTFGALTANASAISINGNVNISAANGYLVMNSSTWTITGTWTNASTSAAWGAGTGTVTFNSATGGTMTFAGATSGTITVTTGSVTASGNWDTSGAGSVFTKGTSTVTMSSVSNIAILNAGNNFNNLTISAAGTVTQTGLVDVSGTLTVNAGAVLATGIFPLTVAGLAANMAGGISGGAAGAKTISGNVSIAASGFFAFGAATWPGRRSRPTRATT